jgi:hypothetical protein
MRLLIVGVLAAAVSAGACNRPEPNGLASSPEAAAARAEPNRDPSAPPASPVATAGNASTTPATSASEAVATPTVTVRELTIPAGTRLPIVLDTTVASDTSQIEQPVQAHLANAIVVDGVTALPSGSRVSGVVTDATRSGKVKGLAHVAVRFDTIVPRGDDERYRIQTGSVGRTAPATKKKDAMKIGIPAAGGAVVGGIIGGKKGAAIGGAAAGGAGTAVVMSTRGEEVRLGKGASLTIRLTEPLTVRVRS